MQNDSEQPGELEWTGERYLPTITGNIRLEHLHRYLLAKELSHGKRLLDIACGEGYGSDLLAGVASSVVGVDISPDAIAHAGRRYRRANLEFRVGGCASIPLPDRSVDIVVSFETIEHHDQHDEMMREVKRVLSAGGLLIISSPDRREYSDIPGYKNPFHVRELYRDEFQALLDSHFRHTAMLGQSVRAGSVVWPLGGSVLADFVAFASPERPASAASDVPPLYLVGLASDEPLVSLPAGLLDGGEFVWSADHAKAAHALAEQLAQTKSWDDGNRQALKSEIESYVARLVELAASRAQSQATLVSVETTLRATRAREATASRELDHMRGSLAATGRELDLVRGSLEGARADLGTILAREGASVQALEQERQSWRTRERDLEAAAAELERQIAVMEQSRSWRLTSALRASRRLGALTLRLLRAGSRSAAAPVAPSGSNLAPDPQEPQRDRAEPEPPAETLPGSSEDTSSDESGITNGASPNAPGGANLAPDPQEPQRDRAEPEPPSRPAETLPGWFYEDASTDYVGLSNGSSVETRIKAIAFYLPQFHPIPENDRWWGKGFTEWSNVSRGKPQFEGHYQPHLPGELGFYDLRLPEVQRRQIELAKTYGLYGFCYHHYWFGGTRLLRQPLEQLLANPELDFPFCLCWANENWTRRWDGRGEEVLIAQRHSPEDDFAFIRDIEPALRDPRYIRVEGRPLLIVYRPELLREALATTERWRAYCRESGIGELFLMSTHAFDHRDPAEFGFDAAMEFAPNNLGAPAITSQMPSVRADYRGAIFDYRYFLEHSRRYEPAAHYPLFRCVTPMWDNEARRPGCGAVFAHSSPARYAEWLENACRYTDEHVGPKNPFVFINAWNEWAEGAHLEPDRRYGYAYLQATAEVLKRFPAGGDRPSIVVVSHDAYFHGAQRLALTLARTLSDDLHFNVEILLCGDGPLRAEFEKVGRVHDFAPALPLELKQRIVQDLRRRSFRAALCNTSVVGEAVSLLKAEGLTVVSLIHELPGLIREYGLEASVITIAREADRVVFPADLVRQRFVELTGMPVDKAVVRPQGLLARNRYTARRAEARHEIGTALGLEEKTRIVLAVGYADRRKGIDLFVEVGLRLMKRLPDVVFVWVGHHETAAFEEASKTIAAAGAERQFLFPGLVEQSDIFFAAADLYLMTSREDPFPLVVLDALDAELPVVAFDEGGGFVELLKRGCGLLVPHLDTARMADAAFQLLTGSSERRAMVECGRQIIDRDFEFLEYARALTRLTGQARPRVSVVVPNYDYARYLPDRLRSIFSQTYAPHEIVFLDDGSSDGSVDVAERLLRESAIPWRIFKSETNQGCYRQWLRGIQEATGDLIWIAEADDDCAPTLLETLVPAFSQESVVLAYCQSKQIDGEGREVAPDYLEWTADISPGKWRQSYVRRGQDEIRDTLVVKNAIPNVSAVLMRKPDLTSIEPLLVTMRNAGDWLVYTHLLDKGDVAYVPSSLNYHRRHAGSVTIGGGGLNLMKETMQVQQYIRSRYEIADEIERKREACLQATYEYLGLNTSGPASFQDHEALQGTSIAAGQ